MNLSFKQFTTYLTLLSIGGGAGWLGNQYLQAQNQANSTSIIPVVRPLPSNSLPSIPENRIVERSSPNFIAEAAERVGAAVVRIDASRKVTSEEPGTFNNPLLKRFFGDRLPEPDQRIRQGTGSGFILSPD
ncbi:MAG: serine protease, partial [Oscillatoriales cyanobacterium SM2_3_0]|nr:serine protease [Oscillatoriales cyanobacterium SM2_3_0]